MRNFTFPTLSGLALGLLVAAVACEDKPGGAPGSGGKGSVGEGGAGGGNEGAAAPSVGASESGGALQGGEAAIGGTSAGNQGLAGDAAGGADAVCGDGVKGGREECDDANTTSGDGCSAACVETCEICERDTCPVEAEFKVIAEGAYSGAFDMPGKAEGGTAVNFPRKDLVRNLMECIYESNCLNVYAVVPGAPAANWDVSMRFCACANGGDGLAFPIACNDSATRIDGPCLDEMIEAAEVDTFLQMTAKLKTRTLPLGRAYELLKYCDAQVCASECLAEETAELRSASLP